MAIVKTTPTPMTVGEYRNAALRHFDTCRVLWRYINLPANSNLKKLPEEDVLKNIFYLTGYVVECAIKYRYLTNKHGQMDARTQTQWTSANLGTEANNLHKRHLEFESQHHKNWSETVIQQLDSTSPLPSYIKSLGNPQNSALMLTPLEERNKDMQASWEPSIRYNYAANGLPLPPNKTDIEAFYQATKSLLRNLAII